MTMYCVRFSPTHPKPDLRDEVIGLFNAHSVESLMGLVDECVDLVPGIEYAPMPPGGIFWSKRAPKVSDLYRYQVDPPETEEDKADPDYEEWADGSYVAELHTVVENGEPFDVTEDWMECFQSLRFKPLPVNEADPILKVLSQPSRKPRVVE